MDPIIIQIMLFAIYVQQFFFIWMLKYKIKNLSKLRNIIVGSLMIMAIYFSYYQINFNELKYHHIVTYSLMLVYCIMYLPKNDNYFSDIISTSFLVVFINSLYWELPLTFFAMLHGEPVKNLLLQSMHFIPIYFLVKKYDISLGKYIKPLCKGLLFSLITALIVIYVDNGLAVPLYVINRFYCVNVLIRIINQNFNNIDKFLDIDVI